MKIAVWAGVAAALVASSAIAKEGDFMVRARAIHVKPDESSSITPIGGKADFSNETVPEVDFSYFITDNIAVELIAAVTKHTAKVKGSTAGASVDVGSAYVVPPTLTLQYHFTELSGFKPYVGAGVNYTMYFREKAGSQTSLDMDNDFGYALQAGVDVPLQGAWGMNFDVKKVWVDADGVWNKGTANQISADIDLDPWIIGAGISYTF